ncbi:hypothetical protein ACFUTV_40335 [Streptomyces sp. NPDC057298]|uniref:hypothetical protein n=1 Tax=Streptomyces sp. NPDC057298 TaxID=3346091 RepID=UPI0036290842
MRELERTTARRSELDTLAAQLAKQLQGVQAEREVRFCIPVRRRVRITEPSSRTTPPSVRVIFFRERSRRGV